MIFNKKSVSIELSKLPVIALEPSIFKKGLVSVPGIFDISPST